MGHKHHYLIETSTAPVALGVCAVCGKEKLFTGNQLAFAVKYGRNDRKDITLVGTSNPEYWERFVEKNFSRDL